MGNTISISNAHLHFCPLIPRIDTNIGISIFKKFWYHTCLIGGCVVVVELLHIYLKYIVTFVRAQRKKM